MHLLLLVFPFLALVLFGAHLMFHGFGLWAFSALIPVVLFFVRRPWVRVVMATLLCLAAVEWIRAGVVLVMERTAQGRPWMLAGAILAGCALFTALSSLVFFTKRQKERCAASEA